MHVLCFFVPISVIFSTVKIDKRDKTDKSFSTISYLLVLVVYSLVFFCLGFWFLPIFCLGFCFLPILQFMYNLKRGNLLQKLVLH